MFLVEGDLPESSQPPGPSTYLFKIDKRLITVFRRVEIALRG